MEVRLLSSHKDEEIWVLSFLMITFKKIVLRSMRKTFLAHKTGKRLGEDLSLKGEEKKIYNWKFSKLSALGKGMSGA